jgi:hypothetical protein
LACTSVSTSSILRSVLTAFGRPLCSSSSKLSLPCAKHWCQDRSIAQAVSRWLPTAAAWVRFCVWSSGICGGQSGAGMGFLRVLRFPLPIIIITQGRYSRPVSGCYADWTQLDSTPPLSEF